MLRRKPVLAAIAAALAALVALVLFVAARDGDETTGSARDAGPRTTDAHADDDEDGTTSSSASSASTSTSGPPSTGTGEGTGSPTTTTPAGDGGSGGASPTTAPPGDGAAPTTTVGRLPTPAQPQGVCGAYDVIEEAAELLFNAELSDADLVNRAHQLADDLQLAASLFRSNAGERYGADAVMYADFLDPVSGAFRAATSRADVEAAGDLLFSPPDLVSEADSRLQDEYDATCQE